MCKVLLSPGDNPITVNKYRHHHINSMSLERETFLNIKCVLNLSTNLSEIFFILRRTERDIITNVYQFSYKATVILIGF